MAKTTNNHQKANKSAEAPANKSASTSGNKSGDISDNSKTSDSSKGSSAANKFKFAGLIAFFVIMAILVWLAWPMFSELVEPGGLDRVIEHIRDAGVGGVFVVLAIQFLQIVVAFIPGEVVQMAAGIIYGPWIGTLLIFIGCVISSAIVFLLVHKLGAPFVQSMVPASVMDRFRKFEQSRKFNIVVFILFLIPGMPKDVFTYITPLSDMRFSTFVILTNIARLPGIVVSTYAANGLVEGRIWESVILFLVLAVIAVFALLFYNRFMVWLEKRTSKDLHTLNELDNK